MSNYNKTSHSQIRRTLVESVSRREKAHTVCIWYVGMSFAKIVWPRCGAACQRGRCGTGSVSRSRLQTNGGTREATEDELRVTLSEEEVQRWRWLRKKRDLERGKCITFAFEEWGNKKVQSDPTAVHCPMEYCQEPVPRAESPTKNGEESSRARLRTCHSCEYSFCSSCKRTWWVA